MQKSSRKEETEDSRGKLRDSMERAFEAYGKLLEMVETFKYLGRVMKAGDEDWPEVVGNLVKSQKSWGRLLQILSGEGAEKRVSGNFFKAVVKTVLLFGAETWVLTLRIERELESFMLGAARQITGKQPRRGGGWEMDIPSSEGVHARGGVRRDSEGHHKEAEYGRAIHCDAANSGPL